MQTVTLSALRTKTRRYADFVASGSAQSVFSDADINAIINEKCKEYYDKLVAVRGHEYFLSSAALSVSPGTSTYSLPATCYELVTVTLEWDSTNHELVEPLNSLVERSPIVNCGTWEMGGPKVYRLSGDQLGGASVEFLPTPATTVTARVRFVPTFEELGDDTAELVAFNGWDKLIALGAAIELRTIKGLPVAALAAEFQRADDRIQQMAEDRLAAQPQRVVDNERGVMQWGRRRWYQGDS